MRAGRDASRGFANAVMFGLLRKSGLPSDLIREAAEWLMVIDRETRGAAKSVIRQLGDDFGLGEDRALVLETEALSKLKATLENCGFQNVFEARRRGIKWTAHFFDVAETLRRTVAEVSPKLSPALLRAIEEEISALEGQIDAEDWKACCDSMTALKSLVVG